MTLETRAGLLGLIGYVLVLVFVLELSQSDPPYVPYVTVLAHVPVAIATLVFLRAARKRGERGRSASRMASLVVAYSYLSLALILLVAAPVVFWDFIA